MGENVNFVLKEINPRNVPHTRLRILGPVWHKKFTMEAVRLNGAWVYSSKIKEFDTNFVASLLEGVKAKVISIGDDGVYALFRNK